jgi:hypothetical protein
MSTKKAATATDFLLVLTPTDGRHPGKSFVGEDCRKLKHAKGAAPMGYKLNWRKIEVTDGRSLGRAIRGLAVGGDSYVIRADVVSPRPSNPMCRTKLFDPAKPWEPVTIVGTPRRWGMIDFDDVCNHFAIDPRRHPKKAVAFLLGLLPPAISAADAFLDWSSSLCVGVPAGTAPSNLRAHLWFVLDEALDEASWKAFLVRLQGFVAAKLRKLGVVDVTPACVDPKVAECQQPIFVAQPLFLVDGRYRADLDPFRTTRYRDLRGGSASVCVARLDRELAADEATRPAAVAAPRKAKIPTTPARQAKAERRQASPSLVPLALLRGARDALAAAAEARADGQDRYRDRCDLLFVHRALLETFNIVIARRENGDTDPRWSAWAEQGGVPEGQRSTFAAMIASLVAEAAPLCLPLEEVRARILNTLRLLVNGAWVDAEWVGCKYESSVLAKFTRAAAGEKDKLGRDTRYHYRRAACGRIVDAQDDEVVALGLRSLAVTERARSASRREVACALVRSDYTDEARRHDVRIAELVVAGNSVRAIASILGLSRGKAIYAVGRVEVQSLIAGMKAKVVEPVAAEVVAIPAKPVVTATAKFGILGITGEVVPLIVPLRPKKPLFAGWASGGGAAATRSRIPLTA